MNAADLNDTERLGLMAALRLTISADDSLSQEELAVINNLVDDLGADAFRKAKANAKEVLKSYADLKPAVSAVTRPEAHRFIYGYALKAAESDGMIPAELKQLSWIAEQWQLEIDPSTGKLR